MQIDLLAGDTVKVTLAPTDMDSLDISYDALTGKERCTKQTLSRLIWAIKQKNNIDLTGQRLFVEAFPKSDGGCMLYISRLDCALKRCTEKKSRPRSLYETFVLETSDIDSVFSLCRALCKVYSDSKSMCSALYKSADGTSYRLCITDIAPISADLKGVAGEFASALGSAPYLMNDTEEYFSLLCEDAVSVICDSAG